MATALCDQLTLTQLGGSAVAGLGGASGQIRSPEVKGSIRVQRFSFTIPAAGAGSAEGDVIELPPMKPTDRIYDLVLLNPALGANVTLSAGKIDSNNSANTDPAHYIPATPVSAPTITRASLNLTEQVGVDPSGAVTDTGDAINSGAPGGGFGSGPIFPSLTIGGGAPTSGAQILGYFLYAGDEP